MNRSSFMFTKKELESAFKAARTFRSFGDEINTKDFNPTDYSPKYDSFEDWYFRTLSPVEPCDECDRDWESVEERISALMEKELETIKEKIDPIEISEECVDEEEFSKFENDLKEFLDDWVSLNNARDNSLITNTIKLLENVLILMSR